MDCDHIREALSARLDGEDPRAGSGILDAHLVGCAPCRRWTAEIELLHRAVRVQAADVVPDLSAAIVAAAPGASTPRLLPGARARLAQPVGAVRWSLFVVALTQLLLALPVLVLGEDVEATAHVARELGAFDVALAVGLLVAAWQPARAWGLLPVAAALGLVLVGTAVLGVVDGSASTLGEAHHLLDLAGVALLWLVARDTRPATSPTNPGGRPSPRRLTPA